MEYKNIFKIVVCVMLLLSTLLFDLSNDILIVFGKFIYCYMIVPWFIGMTVSYNKFGLERNTGYEYKIPLIVFMSVFMMNLEGQISSVDIFSKTNMSDNRIQFWGLLLMLRAVLYGCMIYIWRFKKKNIEQVPEINNVSDKGGFINNKKGVFIKILKNISNVFWTILTLCGIFLLGIVFIFSSILSDGSGIILQTVYIGVMIMCLLSLIGSIYSPIRVKSRQMFSIFFLFYIVLFVYMFLFSTFSDIDYCLDSGRGVWDYEQERCRTDCLTWNWQDKCVPLSGENEVTQPQ